MARHNGADTIIRAFESARSLWQAEIKLIDGKHAIELISINGTPILVHDYAGGNGWQAYAPVTDDGRIDATLDAIAARCRVERAK
jgi:hypothetical protein